MIALSLFVIMLMSVGAQGQDAMSANSSGIRAALSSSDIARIFQKASREEDNEAEHTLGDIYYYGLGETQDFDEAFMWYRRAAQHGYISEEFKKGEMYYTGAGVQQDYLQAYKWYRKAADLWDVPALYKLGVMYSAGQGVGQDFNEAFKWYKKSAQLGDVNGQRTLGRMYYMGLGVRQDYTEAAKWFQRAADQRYNDVSKASVDSVVQMVSGTGWPVSGGYVVSNYHVVEGCRKITLVRLDGVRIPAVIAAFDEINDLVLLRPLEVKNIPPALPLAAKEIRVGEQVFTIGYPHPDMMGAEPKLTMGIINARSGFQNDRRTYQISVPIQAGNSGGPLLSMRGEVVGVVTAKMSAVTIFKWTGDLPQNVNYAVKGEYLRPLINSVQSGSRILPVLPAAAADLATLAERLEKSVLMIICQ